MNDTRRRSKQDPYTKFLGTFGQFNTDTSAKLNLFQTVIPIQYIERLTTAGVAFKAKRFDELIQRDIDKSRVSEIVDTYLIDKRKSVRFFPPLIASIIPHKSGSPESPARTYGKTETVMSGGNEQQDVISKWGPGLFELCVAVEEEATGSTYRATLTGDNNETEFHSLPSSSILNVNLKNVSLVVIDGQHRLEALKRLQQLYPKSAENIDIPVCIVFSPEATIVGEEQDILEHVRELFIKINSKASRVSGHFLTLLRDELLSSIAVREFCDIAKSHPLIPSNESLGTVLNLIEWNQRNDRRAFQKNRIGDITSVGILSEPLNDEKNGPGIFKTSETATLLRLDANRSDLESNDDCPTVDLIAENTFHVSQTDVLRTALRTHVAEPLFILFSEPTPFKDKIDAFSDLVKDVGIKIAKEEDGYAAFKESYIDNHKEILSIKKGGTDSQVALDAFKWFTKTLEEKYKFDDNSYFFTSVFQTALIRLWASLSIRLAASNLTNVQVARLLVVGSTNFAFLPSKDFFAPTKEYTANLLYDQIKVKVSTTSRLGCTNLLAASLLSKPSKKQMIDYLKNENLEEQEIWSTIEHFCLQRKQKYEEELNKAIHNNLKKIWPVNKDSIGDERYDRWVVLQKAAESGDDKAQITLDNEITSLSHSQFISAKSKLDNVIDI